MRKAGGPLQSRLIWKMVGLSVVIHVLVLGWVSQRLKVGTTPTSVRVSIQSLQGTRAIRTSAERNDTKDPSARKRGEVHPPPAISVKPSETTPAPPDHAAAPPALQRRQVSPAPLPKPAARAPEVHPPRPVQQIEKKPAVSTEERMSTRVTRSPKQSTPSRLSAPHPPRVGPASPVQREETIPTAPGEKVIPTSVVRMQKQPTSSPKSVQRTAKDHPFRTAEVKKRASPPSNEKVVVTLTATMANQAKPSNEPPLRAPRVQPIKTVAKKEATSSSQPLQKPVVAHATPEKGNQRPPASSAAPVPSSTYDLQASGSRAEPRNASHVSVQQKGIQPGTAEAEGAAGLRLLHKTDPAYPPGARERGEEGTVWLRLQVLPDGRVGKVEIAQSSGFGSLDRAAVRSTASWKFGFNGRPPTKSAWAKIPIRFEIVSR